MIESMIIENDDYNNKKNLNNKKNNKLMYDFLSSQIEIKKGTESVLINPEEKVYLVSKEKNPTGSTFLNKATHPIACIWHFLVKILALLSYLILPLIFSSEFNTYVIIIIFSALDFWIVKNVTGRF